MISIYPIRSHSSEPISKGTKSSIMNLDNPTEAYFVEPEMSVEPKINWHRRKVTFRVRFRETKHYNKYIVQ